MASETADGPHELVIDCAAKINLHLRVGPLRKDGYHPLLTWMITVGLFDRLSVRANEGQTEAVKLSCDDASLPCDERNLVFRMIRSWSLWVAERGGHLPPVEAHLAKHTPAGAGLGGGSSDAACALVAVNAMTRGLRPNPSAEDLSAFAAGFGSDIPFFLHGPSAVCSGRGEVVRPLPPAAARYAVLLLPGLSLSTAAVYRRFDEMGLGTDLGASPEPDWVAWSKLDAETLMAQLVNDLELPAFALSPELGALRSEAEQSVGRTVRMSGSGSSLFVLFDDPASADAARLRIDALMPRRGLQSGRAVRVDVGPDLRTHAPEG